MNNLQYLCEQQLLAKNALDKAQYELDKINESIESLCDNKREGSKTLDCGGFKATITHKMNRALDKKKYQEWASKGNKFPENWAFVIPDVKMDNTLFKKLENEHPEWLNDISFVTTKPAKTAVSVKKVED